MERRKPRFSRIANTGLPGNGRNDRRLPRKEPPGHPTLRVREGRKVGRALDSSKRGQAGHEPERLAAGGGSANGYVAAATGTVGRLEEEGEDRSVSSKPDALVLFNPVYE